MKRIFTAAFITTGFLISCVTVTLAQSKTTTVHHTTTRKMVYKGASAADIAQGKALFSKADCLSCHKLDVKLVGPAYYDVAKKYPPTAANYAMLANKVIKGGSGVWGQVPMAPHPNLTFNDAEKITKYILSLKPGKS
jgi:cytochrome c